MAKRVSKKFGTKTPGSSVKRSMPAKGKRPTSQRMKANAAGRKGVKVLTSEGAKNVGRPGFKGNVPGPLDGKSSIRRVMQRDPARGSSLPQADKITASHVDLIGKQKVKIVSQPQNSEPKNFNSGRKVVRPPRKSSPVRAPSPGRVRRGPK